MNLRDTAGDLMVLSATLQELLDSTADAHFLENRKGAITRGGQRAYSSDNAYLWMEEHYDLIAATSRASAWMALHLNTMAEALWRALDRAEREATND